MGINPFINCDIGRLWIDEFSKKQQAFCDTQLAIWDLQ